MTVQYQADPKTLTSFGRDVGSNANRSLELLKAIESTIDALCYEQRVYEGYARFAHQVLERMRTMKATKPIDPDGAVGDTFLKAQTAIRELHSRLLAKYQSAVHDVRLTEEDGVAAEYQQLIGIVADLHDCLNDLRWAVGEHDADLCEARGPVLTSAEEIERHLR